MSDDVWKRDEIESPCVKICVVDRESRLCLGCHRSLDEISDWTRMGATARAEVMAQLPARAEKARPTRRGGRAARRSSA